MVPAQNEYFMNLKQAIGTILNLSPQWNMSITVGDLPKGRRFSLTSNVGVSILISSLSASPGDILTLQSKSDSPAFLDQLNAQGFKASIASLQLVTSASGECAIRGFTPPLESVSLVSSSMKEPCIKQYAGLCTEYFLLHL